MLIRLLYPAALACFVLGCSERSGPVEPADATTPALQRSGPPTPLDPTPFIDPSLEAICGFPVEIMTDGKVKDIFLPDGRLLGTSPGLHVTATNVTSGRSIRVNATGPVTFDAEPDGGLLTTWNGRSLWVFPEGQGSRFVILIGRFTMRVGPDGEVVQPLQGNGQILNACELIA